MRINKVVILFVMFVPTHVMTFFFFRKVDNGL